MSININRDLPGNAYDAAVGANSPSSANVFATMADILAGTGDAERLVFNVKINQVGGINKGQAVYVSGANGTNILVSKADYSTEATSSKTLGLLVASGANNAFGQVIANGILKGTGAAPLDTSAATAGDPVWLGDDGNLIYGLVNKPYAPNHLVFLGIVVESNSTVGEIFVKVQNGFELEEIHDVDLISVPPQNGNVLTFNSVTGLWEATPIPGLNTGGTQLLSGGASWSGTGMLFDVSALTYTIDGDYYSSAPQNVTLAAGDPSNPRFDAIVVDATGTVSVITGTPAANPIVPSIPGTQVLVQYVLVAAGATTPSITNEFVYREGSSPDWTATFVSSGAGTALTGSFTSTTPTPFQGAQCTLVNAPTYNLNKVVRYVKPSGSIARADFPFLSFRVQLLTGSANRNVLVRLFNGGTFVGNVWASSYGLNLTSLNTWQLVVIPLVTFGNAGQLNVTRVEFAFSGTVATSTQIALDDIKFQSGYGPQTNTATIDILDSGTVIGSTAKLNFVDGTNTTVTVTDDVPNNKIDVQVDASNIYTTDGQLLGNRTVDGNNFGFEYQNLNFLSVNLLGVTPQTDLIQISGNPTNVIAGTRLFTILDAIASKRRLAILKTGEVEINEEYKLPLVDGTPNQTIVTNGAGNLSFQDAPNIYNNDGTLSGLRTLSGNQENLLFDNLGLFYVKINPPILQDWGVNVRVDTTNLTPGSDGTPFRVMRDQDNKILFASVEDGRVNVNEAYYLPSSAGALGEVLTSAGGSVVNWQSILSSIPYLPPVIPLFSFGTQGATFLANGNGAGGQYYFSATANNSILTQVSLDNAGKTYDASNLKLRIHWQLFSTVPLVTDTVIWRVTYVYITNVDDADSKVATVVQNTISVGTRLPNRLYTDDLNVMPGVANAKLLNISVARLGNTDTYPNTADLFGIELIKV